VVSAIVGAERPETVARELAEIVRMAKRRCTES
jgi:hypothetical protein